MSFALQAAMACIPGERWGRLCRGLAMCPSMVFVVGCFLMYSAQVQLCMGANVCLEYHCRQLKILSPNGVCLDSRGLICGMCRGGIRCLFC